MFNNQIIVFIVFCSLMFVIVLVLFIIRKSLIRFDKWLSDKLKQISRRQTAPEQDVIALPTASYSVKELSPEGHILSEKSFLCAGQSLDEALQGLTYLKNLSEVDKTCNKKK